MTVERNMQSDLMDCTLEEFIHTIYSFQEEDASSVLAGMLGLIRAIYQQTELAHIDLRARIEAKDSYTDEEAKLFLDHTVIMMKAEERSRLIVLRLQFLDPSILETLENKVLTEIPKDDTIVSQ